MKKFLVLVSIVCLALPTLAQRGRGRGGINRGKGKVTNPGRRGGYGRRSNRRRSPHRRGPVRRAPQVCAVDLVGPRGYVIETFKEYGYSACSYAKQDCLSYKNYNRHYRASCYYKSTGRYYSSYSNGQFFGALAGSSLGGRNGRVAGAVIGGVLGAVIANEVQDNNRNNRSQGSSQRNNNRGQSRNNRR